MMGTSDTLVGAATVFPKTENNMQSEVANQNPSENRPLLDKDGKQNISSPANDGIPDGTANHTGNSHEVVRSNDAPIAAEPVPIFVQPTSAVALSDKVADVGSNEEPRETHCCGCDEWHCHCNCGERSCMCGKGPDGYRCVVL